MKEACYALGFVILLIILILIIAGNGGITVGR